MYPKRWRTLKVAGELRGLARGTGRRKRALCQSGNGLRRGGLEELEKMNKSTPLIPEQSPGRTWE